MGQVPAADLARAPWGLTAQTYTRNKFDVTAATKEVVEGASRYAEVCLQVAAPGVSCGYSTRVEEKATSARRRATAEARVGVEGLSSRSSGAGSHGEGAHAEDGDRATPG